MEQHAAVAFHRPAYVAQQHERPRLRLAATRRPVDQLAAVAQVGPHGAAQIEDRTATGGPASRPSRPELPLEIGNQTLGGRHLRLGELLEVLGVQRVPAAVAERSHPLHLVARLAACVPVLSLAAGRQLRLVLRLSGAPRLAHRAQIARRPVPVRPPPEHPERLVERLQVLDPVHQQATQGVVEVGPAPDVDVRERRGDLARPARLHVQPQPVQHPDEVQQVMEQVGHPLVGSA